jgi:NAD(P)-dependent dehydrogenase (short-subunit alcohol dehydrogenase family)
VPDSAQRISVLLGGTGGVGSQIAERLAEPGAVLVLSYLSRSDRALVVAERLRAKGAEVALVEGNIASPDTHELLVASVERWGGLCHRLVHSVALTSFKPLRDVRPNQWDLTLGVSARSLLDVVRALREPLVRARASVVAISSQGSRRFLPGYGALGPAKAALEATVRQLAVELSPEGVRVNGVCAGLLEGETLRHFPAEVCSEVIRRTPLGRLGRADEVAEVVCFLLGPASSWILGQIVEVDGGFSLV